MSIQIWACQKHLGLNHSNLLPAHWERYFQVSPITIFNNLSMKVKILVTICVCFITYCTFPFIYKRQTWSTRESIKIQPFLNRQKLLQCSLIIMYGECVHFLLSGITEMVTGTRFSALILYMRLGQACDKPVIQRPLWNFKKLEWYFKIIDCNI